MVVGEMAAHVDYSVEYAAGGKVPIESRVPVGTPLRLTFSLKNESQYTQLGISGCRALPDLNGQSEKWIDLVDDRCFYPPTVQGYVMSRNKDAASVYFQAVRILPSFALHLRCSLYACTRQDQDKCDMRNIDKRKCPPRKPSLRRKRGISMPGAGFNYTVITTSILLDDTSDVRVSSVADNSRGAIFQKTHLSEVLVWVIVSAACISLVVLLVTLAICLHSMLSARRYKTSNCNSTVA
ncbi:uncharacterized protein LOC112557844 [Pomacea canaliculata]|uniref:uncharacterized protein LOC112557844 n=1 Tax=Pomacea canaliculata TaxID=400727 RepID=UPI000D725E3B|nr:uncharacterized protein LOC112557844 [Pomacea canaliculata]